MSTEMYCVFHKEFHLRHDNSYFTFFGVNETYPKKLAKNVKMVLEYDLEIYNPFLQKRGYMESSAYLHVYWNKLYLGKDMVGFSQYDMVHYQKYDNLENAIYLMNTGQSIVNRGKWSPMMCPDIRNLDFLINSYNRFFSKDYSIATLENMPLSLWQTNIYPVGIYEKLCRWLEVLVEEIYPWSNLPPYETHFGSIGGYTERALSIFNAFEIHEGSTYRNLKISHGLGACEKEQYNKSSFLNFYTQDIHSRFIADITGKYPHVNYSMFKACCEFNGVLYSCERINRALDGNTGLYFLRDDDIYATAGFDIEAEDPRIFVCNDRVFVVFICLSPYGRTIGITAFDEWRPVFLRVDGMNTIEKNWAPFVKNDELYFVYNYNPLVILKYDFNPEGICSLVYGNMVDTSTTWLRGGSNLIPFPHHSGYFIGGCHSRIVKFDCYEHYTHIVLLDTNSWTLVYVSKPVMYCTEPLKGLQLNSWWVQHSNSMKPLDTLHNILIDKTPHIIQDPVSLYMKGGKYYITINVRDCVSLLYEISFANLLDFSK